MAQTHRTSMERHNAPYRGVSSREDDVNFNLSVMHDLAYAEKVAGGNQIKDGHKQHIKENFSAILHEEGDITASAPTAGILVTKIETIPDTEPHKWLPVDGGVIRELPGWKKHELTGSVNRSGMRTIVKMEPGEVLVLRSKIEVRPGAKGTSFSWGAKTFNGPDDELDTLLTKNYITGTGKNSGTYVEKRLCSESRQEVEVVMYVIDGVEGTTSLLLTDFSLSLYEVQPSTVSGIDLSLKRAVNETAGHLQFLEDQILEQKGEWD